MDDSPWLVLIPLFAIIGVAAYSIVRAQAHARVRELEVRERIAMIERGLVPAPEKDPNGFDRAMQVVDRYRTSDWDRSMRRSPSRYRSAGITLMGVGLGLMLLIGVAGNNPSSGVGVGGFILVMGLAFFVNSLMSSRDDYPIPQPPPQRPPSSTPEAHPPQGRVNGPV
jgi:hypothetical protein